MYVAMHELADGYPDPETGECTALSSAFTFDAVAGFIVVPGPEETEDERWADILVDSLKSARSESE